MRLRTFLFSTLTALAVISCGGGGSGGLAGGIGGTGVSSGPATAFGSVIVNGVEYNTDSANFKIEGTPVGVGSTGQQQLAVGMMVSVTHDNSKNAKSVSFQDNAEGPVANIVVTDPVSGAGTFTVMGLTVTVNKLTVFSRNTSGLIGTSALVPADIVEVSGQLTGTNAILATRVEKKSVVCEGVGLRIEVKGTVSNVNPTGLGSFDISSSGATLQVNANGHMPSGLAAGNYVEVTSTACPSGSTLIASAIDNTVSAGPDLRELDHPGQGDLEVKGIVSGMTTTPQGCLFSINGQQVSATTSLCATLLNVNLVEAHGQLCSACFGRTNFISAPFCSHCGVPFASTDQCGTAGVCPACQAHPPVFRAARAALRYDEQGRRMILPLKHGDRVELACGKGIHRSGIVEPFELHVDARLLEPTLFNRHLPRHPTGPIAVADLQRRRVGRQRHQRRRWHQQSRDPALHCRTGVLQAHGKTPWNGLIKIITKTNNRNTRQGGD